MDALLLATLSPGKRILSPPPVTLNGLADSHAETAARTAAEAQLTQAAEADFVSEAAAAPPPFPPPPLLTVEEASR